MLQQGFNMLTAIIYVKIFDVALIHHIINNHMAMTHDVKFVGRKISSDIGNHFCD